MTALLFCFFCLTIYIGRTSTSQPWPTQKQHENTASRYQAALAQLNLTKTFELRRQCLKPRQRHGLERHSASVFNVSGNFLNDAIEITTSELLDPDVDARTVTPQCSVVTFDVPAPMRHVPKTHEPDTSSLMLGMVTTLERLGTSIFEIAHWLADSPTPLVIILHDQIETKGEEAEAVMAMAHTLHVQLVLVPGDEFASKGRKAVVSEEEDAEAPPNFGLARAFMKHKTAATRWFGIIEDDTFFISLPAMIRELEQFSADQPYYVGALSERHLGTTEAGIKAWGGAGIFLTLPLVSKLAANAENCLTKATTSGDTLWRDCIALSTKPPVQLTQLPGLHQLDMYPVISGWYESGPWPLLTLHHWKSWYKFAVPDAHLVVALAGAHSLFARFAFNDESLVFTNAYSIVQYPEGIPDLGLVENTFTAFPDAEEGDTDREYRYSLGKLRPRLREGTEKRSWILEHAINDAGTVRQFYVRRGAGRGGTDSVIEVDWVR